MTANRYRPTPATALIVSPDPLAGALFGAAVELTGVRPLFPAHEESARDALRRFRPAYLLIDCDDPAASDESLLGPAMMRSARLFLFGNESRIQAQQHIAIRYHIATIILPRDTDHLASLLALPQPSRTERPPR